MTGYFVTATHNIGVPIEQRRGIEFLDLNDYLVLVQAPIEQVGQALCQTRQVACWERNVYEREIELVEQSSAIIFQFRKHSWTIIQSSNFFPFGMSLYDEDAQSLSHWLHTKALSYLVSDTGGYFGYHLFNCGESLERFYYDENELIEVTDADADEMEFVGVPEFRSQLRPEKASEVKERDRALFGIGLFTACRIAKSVLCRQRMLRKPPCRKSSSSQLPFIAALARSNFCLLQLRLGDANSRLVQLPEGMNAAQ